MENNSINAPYLIEKAPYLVKDINPGFGFSDPRQLINVNDTLFFIANDGDNLGLWKTDGTEENTVKVKDIYTDFDTDSDIEIPQLSLSNINGTLFFTAYDTNSGWELWKTDGTETVLVKDIDPGSDDSSPTQLTDVNGTLFFIANGDQLWKSDGTENGTVRVKNMQPGSESPSPTQLTNINGTLYFVADDGASGKELWKSDGTLEGTVLVKDIKVGSNSSEPQLLTNVNGTLFFTIVDLEPADDSVDEPQKVNSVELWKSDGTEQGTVKVKSSSDLIFTMTEANDTLFFSTGDPITGTSKVWKSDGTETGTIEIKSFSNTRLISIAEVDGNVYLATTPPSELITDDDGDLLEDRDFNLIGELFQTDGTEAGTIKLRDIRADEPESLAIPLQVISKFQTFSRGEMQGLDNPVAKVGCKLFFSNALLYLFGGIENEPNGVELYAFDATANDVFTVSEKFQFNLIENSQTQLNELGVFVVDDEEGTINGIAPCDKGYAEAAIERAKVVFSNIADVPNGFNSNEMERVVEFNPGENVRFLLVKDGTLDGIRVGNIPTENVLLSSATTQQITENSDGSFTLAWEDGSNASSDFKDLVVNFKATDNNLLLGSGIQGDSQAEVIDLRDITQQVKATFTLHREAAYDNFVGFYKVDDAQGTITDEFGNTFTPGDDGYAELVVKQRIPGVELSVGNNQSVTIEDILSGGSLFAPFIISNANPDNLNGDFSNVYTPYITGNSDQVDHIRLLGDNTFGFEDLAGGGDNDFNDMIAKVDFTVV